VVSAGASPGVRLQSGLLGEQITYAANGLLGLSLPMRLIGSYSPVVRIVFCPAKSMNIPLISFAFLSRAQKDIGQRSAKDMLQELIQVAYTLSKLPCLQSNRAG